MTCAVKTCDEDGSYYTMIGDTSVLLCDTCYHKHESRKRILRFDDLSRLCVVCSGQCDRAILCSQCHHTNYVCYQCSLVFGSIESEYCEGVAQHRQ
jgi:hypothetical protein